MRRFKKKCEQRSRVKSSASSQWLWWGLAASLDQQVVTPDRQPSPHGAPSSFSLRQTLLCQDYVWHHIETVSFSRTLKLCFCMQFSWNQRLSSNIYWLSDKGLWRFRDSQFLLTCFKGKVVSTQFLDSSQYFFFLNTGVNALLYHSSGHTKQNSHLMVTPIFKIKFKFLSMVWRYLRKGILLDPALVFIWTLSLLMSHPTEWFIILFHAVDLSVACFSFCLLTLFSFFHL